MDRYARNADIGDAYSRGYRSIEGDRAELLAGYSPAQPRRRFEDNNEPEPMTAEEEEEAVGGIKQDTRQLKQESVQSSRNALRIAREVEETARNTLLKLGDQSEKIANTERRLDLANGSNNRAGDRTDELKQLNRSIFRPSLVFNKDAKRQREEQRISDRHELERLEREKAMLDVRETRNRLGNATGCGQPAAREDTYGEDAEGITLGRRLLPEQQATRQAARSRYQFEATTSDDELEDELGKSIPD